MAKADQKRATRIRASRLLGAVKDVIGTVATTVIGLLAGAHVFRVHDVKPNFEALRVALAVVEGAPGA